MRYSGQLISNRPSNINLILILCHGALHLGDCEPLPAIGTQFGFEDEAVPSFGRVTGAGNGTKA